MYGVGSPGDRGRGLPVGTGRSTPPDGVGRGGQELGIAGKSRGNRLWSE
jgi:hypothetical protein